MFAPICVPLSQTVFSDINPELLMNLTYFPDLLVNDRAKNLF